MKSIDWRRALALALLAGLASSGAAQVPLSKVFDGAPAASWIAPPDAPPDAFGVFHFRRTFDLRGAARAVRRPRLGRQPLPALRERPAGVVGAAALGPHALALRDGGPRPALRAGRNVLAALVWNWGAERPVAQFSHRTAFLLQGDSEREAVVNTGPEWKVLRNSGYAPIPVRGPASRRLLRRASGRGGGRRRYPWGWEQARLSRTTSWPAGRRPREGWGAARTAAARRPPSPARRGGWQLVPRSIPPMEETPSRFARVRRAEGIEPSDGFLRGTGDLVIPARTQGACSCSTSRT